MKIPINGSGLDRGTRIAAGDLPGWVFASGARLVRAGDKEGRGDDRQGIAN